MPPALPSPTHHLLDFLDAHGALLADFHFFSKQEVLWVRWHGHLTPTLVVEATQAGAVLRPNGRAPRRLLSDQSRTSGDWREALPWMQYEWLPDAVRHGLRAMAFVLSPDPTGLTDERGFVVESQGIVVARAFRSAEEAWQWLLEQD